MASPNSRATSRRTTAPKPRVDFDLDKLEREGDQPEPFTFRHGGREFTLADPVEIDYRDIVEMGESALGQALIIKRLLGEDQYEALVEAGPLPQWKIEPLLRAWQEHYGQPSLGEAAASPG
jgi:hypothetical protein